MVVAINHSRVWVCSQRWNQKVRFYLRWDDPTTGKRESKPVGDDRREAGRLAAELERELERGSYRQSYRMPWDQFVADHVKRIAGRCNAREAAATLKEFGEVCHPREARFITFGMIEQYAAHLAIKGTVKNAKRPGPGGGKRYTVQHPKPRTNSLATINKKLRYLRVAFNKAVRRGVMASNPMAQWDWAREDDRFVRVLSFREETKLLATAQRLYGGRYRALIVVALATGGRKSELMRLTWSRIELGDGEGPPGVKFTMTKGKKDRVVPLPAVGVEALRRLKAQTLHLGGPFLGMDKHAWYSHWGKVVAGAGITERLTLHDLRRTYVTRMLDAGIPPHRVTKLAGHASITTTLKHYCNVDDAGLRSDVERAFAKMASQTGQMVG